MKMTFPVFDDIAEDMYQREHKKMKRIVDHEGDGSGSPPSLSFQEVVLCRCLGREEGDKLCMANETRYDNHDARRDSAGTGNMPSSLHSAFSFLASSERREAHPGSKRRLGSSKPGKDCGASNISYA